MVIRAAWWLILCVNLTAPQGDQIFGQILFWCFWEGVLDEIKFVFLGGEDFIFYLFLKIFYFYFILLYNTVLVLPYTDMKLSFKSV